MWGRERDSAKYTVYHRITYHMTKYNLGFKYMFGFRSIVKFTFWLSRTSIYHGVSTKWQEFIVGYHHWVTQQIARFILLLPSTFRRQNFLGVICNILQFIMGLRTTDEVYPTHSQFIIDLSSTAYNLAWHYLVDDKDLHGIFFSTFRSIKHWGKLTQMIL